MFLCRSTPPYLLRSKELWIRHNMQDLGGPVAKHNANPGTNPAAPSKLFPEPRASMLRTV